MQYALNCTSFIFVFLLYYKLLLGYLISLSQTVYGMIMPIFLSSTFLLLKGSALPIFLKDQVCSDLSNCLFYNIAKSINWTSRQPTWHKKLEGVSFWNQLVSWCKYIYIYIYISKSYLFVYLSEISDKDCQVWCVILILVKSIGIYSMFAQKEEKKGLDCLVISSLTYSLSIEQHFLFT